MIRPASLLALVVLVTAAQDAGAQATGLPPVAPPGPGIASPRIGGYVQARSTLEQRVGLTTTLNRARVSVEGGLPNRFTYRLMAEFEAGGSARTASTVSLRDAYIRWTRDWLAFQAGQFKTPFSRNFVTSLTLLETVDRPSVVDTLATKRDIGAMVEYLPRPEASLSLGVFNGEGQNLPSNRDSTVLVVSRAVIRPLSQVSLGASGAAYEGDSTRWGLEASVEQHGALLRAEWVAQHRRGHSANDEGWFVLGGMRVLPWAQLVAQWEDFKRPFMGPGFRMRATTVGANLDLGASRTRLTLEYVDRRSGVTQAHRRTGLAQLQVRF